MMKRGRFSVADATCHCASNSKSSELAEAILKKRGNYQRITTNLAGANLLCLLVA